MQGPADLQNLASADVPTLQATIELDGELNESVWKDAALLDGFTELEPIEGLPADPKSEVLLWRSRTHLYIGLRFFEPDPASMVAQNKHRDAFLNEDDRVQ